MQLLISFLVYPYNTSSKCGKCNILKVLNHHMKSQHFLQSLKDIQSLTDPLPPYFTILAWTQPIYWFADIIGQYLPVADISI